MPTRPKKKSTAKRNVAAKSPGVGKASAKKTVSKKISGLDAAARVLAETGQPMSAKELVEVMLAKKYCSSTGQTPDFVIPSRASEYSCMSTAVDWLVHLVSSVQSSSPVHQSVKAAHPFVIAVPPPFGVAAPEEGIRPIRVS